jgi:sirohydrochlorin ferrochelatase
MQKYMIVARAVIASLVLSSAGGLQAQNHQTALMVVAHGSHDPSWNRRVSESVERINWPGPKAVAFLTTSSASDSMAAIAARLDQPGIARIEVVPLLVSSFSGHYEEIRYYVGARKDLPSEEGEGHGEHEAMVPLKTKAPLGLTRAMDGHPLVTRILADQLRPYATNASAQSVVLVAHGPNEDSENERWLGHLGDHAERLRKEFGFARVDAATLRDDAPKAVREAATEKLRSMVLDASAKSQVLVLPVLVSVGHVQDEIKKRLAGLNCEVLQGGIANHPLAAEWIREQALAGSQSGETANATVRK